ncbi:MAG: phenylacetate--CoA ligase family protein [Anaerolineae bacterium]
MWRRLSPRSHVWLPAFQDVLLRQTLRAAARRSPFYKRRLTDCSATAASIHHVSDLPQLGFFTEPSDLRHDPMQFLAVPPSRVAHTITTAGTTGKPKHTYLTASDWRRLTHLVALGMQLNGITTRDVVHILYCYAETDWVVGPLLEAAFRRLGVPTVQAGNALPIEEQICLMRSRKSTVLIGTPSYLHRLTEEAQKYEPDLRSLGIRLMFLGAEAWSEAFRQYLQQRWGARVYDSYGMTEMGLAGGTECHRQDGLHTSPYLVFEVIDPDSGRALEPGQEGELVVTTLRREAMPLIRYRTGDIAVLLPAEPCPCGIPTARISRIKGRSDQMVCLGTGENLYPGDLDTALLGLPAICGYQLIIGKQGYKDTLTLLIESETPSQQLADAIVQRLYQGLGFLEHDVRHSQTVAPPVVEFATPGTLRARSPIKLRRIVDQRRAPVDVDLPHD